MIYLKILHFQIIFRCILRIMMNNKEEETWEDAKPVSLIKNAFINILQNTIENEFLPLKTGFRSARVPFDIGFNVLG